MAKQHINPDQLALFDAPETPLRPGQMSPTQWLEHHEDQLAYHGTLRDDWEQAPTAHMGSLKSAEKRINQVITDARPNAAWVLNYFDPTTSNDNVDDRVSLDDYVIDDPSNPDYGREGIPLEAKVHVRRLEGDINHIPDPSKTNHGVSANYSDIVANRADLKHWKSEGYEFDEVPKSVRDSARFVPDDSIEYQSHVKAAKEALEEGRPVSYNNYIEDSGNKSYVVPRGASSSWEGDVLLDRGASQHFKDYALQRQITGRAGTTEFEVYPDIHSRSTEPASQHQLMGSGYKYFDPSNRRRMFDSYQFNSLF